MRAPASLICALAMAFITNARISTIFLGVIVVLGVALFFIVNRARKYFTAAFPKYDALNASVQENVSAIRVVKAYVREDYEREYPLLYTFFSYFGRTSALGSFSGCFSSLPNE